MMLASGGAAVSDAGDATFIRRVVLKNYRSIHHCDVTLGPLTFIVGPNGCGKSNFLDALAFVSDAVEDGLDNAFRKRGGFGEVRRKGAPRSSIGIELTFHSEPSQRPAVWQVRIAPASDGLYAVAEERAEPVAGSGTELFPDIPFDGLLDLMPRSYAVKDGTVCVWPYGWPHRPASAKDLYIRGWPPVSGMAVLEHILGGIRCHNPYPNTMRAHRPPDARPYLAPDGGNAAAVIGRLPTARCERIVQSLRAVVPAVLDVRKEGVGSEETLLFTLRNGGSGKRRFWASSMSDGTLRALGILVALYQPGPDPMPGPLLVGIEEPETALHPAALKVILDCMREASQTRQVVVTTHSTDLLDDPDIPTEAVLAAEMVNGETIIGPVDDVGRQALKEGLFTPGELLRMGQLAPQMDPGK